MKFPHAAIANGQAIFSHKESDAGSLSVHPAICCGLGQVIEATGGGLRKRPAEGIWDAFRCNQESVSRREFCRWDAALCAAGIDAFQLPPCWNDVFQRDAVEIFSLQLLSFRQHSLEFAE